MKWVKGVSFTVMDGNQAQCGEHIVLYVLVAQLGLTLFDPMDCSPPDSSVHGILQARMLLWVAMPSSRGSS